MSLRRKWNIYVINHSHTDIGYTERQEKIMRYHYDFIRQAIKILDEVHENHDSWYQGYKWQCENYWQVENFYKWADKETIEKFEHYVSTGEIGLSGNYLNMTELVSGEILDSNLDEMEKYSQRINHPITSGMCCDIDGLAWGYSEALYSHGVKRMFSCLHPHHGMFPLYNKCQPFYWITPGGNKILMWNGELYHYGNELFLAPHAGTTYTFHDKYEKPWKDNCVFTDRESVHDREIEIAKYRVTTYLEDLEAENYLYNIAPLMVSGSITDNAPPGKEIAKRLKELNAVFGGQVVFCMATLDDFFDDVERECTDIPEYSGDFTDWWADGTGSTPAAVKLYLDGARKFDICRKLDPEDKLGRKGAMVKSAEELALFAEHTWGYSSSVSEPWESLVNALELKKIAYAINGHTDISENLDCILAAKGEVSIRQGRPQKYLLINPHDRSVHSKAYLYIEFWEYVDGLPYDSSTQINGMGTGVASMAPVKVIESATGKELPTQVKKIARAVQVEIDVEMQPKEEKIVELHTVPPEYHATSRRAYIGAEGVEDLICTDAFRIDADRVETDDFVINFADRIGIDSIICKKDGKDILRPDKKEGAFSGVYEITPIEVNPCETRRRMGRNRKEKNTVRDRAVLTDRRIVENGDIYATTELSYKLMGTEMYKVFLKAYKHSPRIEVMVRVHKDSHWEPENLYVSLPFFAGQNDYFYINKTGCIIRPGIDQLPGTCQDFYLIQNTMVWQDGDKAVAVIAKDAPLISLGGLEAKPVVLCDGHDKERNHSLVYSWPMNNFWETNFKVDLAGFYEFSYTLAVTGGRVEDIFRQCEAENEGLISCYTE